MENEQKVSREVALKELEQFLRKHKSKEFRRNKLSSEKIEKEYIDLLEAIEDGNLIFENLRPIYTLISPLYAEAEDSSLVVNQVNFRSRIKEGDKILVMDGLDVEKERGTYAIKLISYITKLSITEVKELEKDDFGVLNQICSVF